MNKDHLAQIDLHCKVFGIDYPVAFYLAPVVPRVGEIITLNEPINFATDKSYIGRFLVHEVVYGAYKLHHINIVSNDVRIEVTPIDDDARSYVNQLAGLEEGPAQ
jgi:hypothetical protein